MSSQLYSIDTQLSVFIKGSKMIKQNQKVFTIRDKYNMYQDRYNFEVILSWNWMKIADKLKLDNLSLNQETEIHQLTFTRIK